MADKPISGLTDADALTGAELMHMEQSGNSRKGATGLFAILDMAGLFTKAQGVAPVALSDAASIATDASLSNIFTVTLGGNRALANPTNLVAGKTYIWVITQDGTGSRTLAFGSSFLFPGGSAPTLTTAAGSVDLIVGLAISSTQMFCNSILDMQ